MKAENAAVSLLIVDDDPDSLARLSGQLAKPGLEIMMASDPDEALDIVWRRHPRIVVTTQQRGYTDLPERIVEIDPAIRMIRLAANDSDEQRRLRSQQSIEELRERIGRVVGEIHAESSAETGEGLPMDPEFEGMVGRGPVMADLFTRMRRIAPFYRSVLIVGETGTGKDLAARAIHRLSPVSKGRYVVLNCSAVVETLFESELFGHVKGSFTGAICDKAGLFEHAHGGTLFLDEIGDMPLATQAKLLRVLQNQEVQRVGSLSTRKVDVRVIAATNHDLRALVARKRFREDLYYRFSMVEIRMPRLAERTEDLPLLERHFLRRFAAEYGKPIDGLNQEASRRLAEHSWPGNVRELGNAIGHAAMMTSERTIGIRDLPAYLQGSARDGIHAAPFVVAPNESFSEHERRLLIQALESAGGNQSKAARALRIGRDALRYKLRKHCIDVSGPERELAAAG